MTLSKEVRDSDWPTEIISFFLKGTNTHTIGSKKGMHILLSSVTVTGRHFDHVQKYNNIGLLQLGV